jgi:hypothetical protein
MDDRYYRVENVMECLKCSNTKAYIIMRNLNEELKKKGYMTLRGRVPKKYFEERFNLVR